MQNPSLLTVPVTLISLARSSLVPLNPCTTIVLLLQAFPVVLWKQIKFLSDMSNMRDIQQSTKLCFKLKFLLNCYAKCTASLDNLDSPWLIFCYILQAETFAKFFQADQEHIHKQITNYLSLIFERTENENTLNWVNQRSTFESHITNRLPKANDS